MAVTVLVRNVAGPGAQSCEIQDSKNRDRRCRLEPGQEQSFEVRGALRISQEVAGFEDEERAKTSAEMSAKERKAMFGSPASPHAARDASEEDAAKRGGSKNPGEASGKRDVDMSANDAPGANTTGEDTEENTAKGASRAKASQNLSGRETTAHEKDPATDRFGAAKDRKA